MKGFGAQRREQGTMSKWQERFSQKIGMVKEVSCSQFETTAKESLEPVFEQYREFTSQQGLTAAIPVSRPGIRTYKFSMTENAYVLMSFRFAGFEHCEMQGEVFVPGADRNKLTPEHVELVNFDVGWVRRMFEQTLDAFIDAFVQSLKASEAVLIRA